jgi:hypothetical protein
MGPACQWYCCTAPAARQPLAPDAARLAPHAAAPTALAARLAPHAAISTEPPSRPLRSEAADARPSPCHLAARPSSSCCAAVPALVSRLFPRSFPVRRWGAAIRSPCSAASTGRARAVQLDRARIRPSGTQIDFSIFLNITNSLQIQKFV